jgi:electron transport complex protein RnfE
VNSLFKGLLRRTPFRPGPGPVSSLAVSTTVNNALGMSAATVVVLMGSNLVISLLRKQIPDDIHIPAYIVVIATFVDVGGHGDAGLSAGTLRISGHIHPLIVVNCIILGRAEAFASKNTVGSSLVDALAMGIGFTVGLTAIALVREVLGAGTITIFPDGGVITIPGLSDAPGPGFRVPGGCAHRRRISASFLSMARGGYLKMTYVGIILTYVFVSNLVLSQFLGLCPFIGVSKNTESAVRNGFCRHVRYESGHPHHLGAAAFHPDSAEHRVSSDGDVHSGDCVPGAAGGDGRTQILPAALSGPGDLSASHHHQLRCARNRP